MRHLTEIRKRCLEAFEKNDCEGLKRLALQQVHLSAPGMQIALGYYESCSRQRAFTNASIAFKSGRCKEAVKYYRAGLPGQMRNKKVLSEYRENCRIYRREVLKRGSKP